MLNEIKRASPYPGGPSMSFCIKNKLRLDGNQTYTREYIAVDIVLNKPSLLFANNDAVSFITPATSILVWAVVRRNVATVTA